MAVLRAPNNASSVWLQLSWRRGHRYCQIFILKSPRYFSRSHWESWAATGRALWCVVGAQLHLTSLRTAGLNVAVLMVCWEAGILESSTEPRASVLGWRSLRRVKIIWRRKYVVTPATTHLSSDAPRSGSANYSPWAKAKSCACFCAARELNVVFTCLNGWGKKCKRD